MHVHLLHCEDRLSWSLMPEACQRLRRFCEEADTFTSPKSVVDAFQSHFVSQDPGMLLYVVLEPDGIVGHMLINVERWGDKAFASVFQYKADRFLPPAEVDREIRRHAPDFVRWAAHHGATEIQGYAINEAIARLLRKRFGLRQHRILMRANIAEGVARLGLREETQGVGGASVSPALAEKGASS